ncbi:DUF2087 domain-containing protein [Phaeospirillum tilakii]|uniref:DUF2087 domain-containing protein n=1 Tax=Phaeospirillum tilakii TaxID=741673 RepID=A0ABW5C854_9PROT
MARPIFPFAIGDISALARSLGRELASRDGLPGHVDLLNILSRSAGFRNFQHFRAQAAAADRLARPPVSPVEEEPVDLVRVERVLRLFDPAGRLIRWPGKDSQRVLCLWALWAAIPAGRRFAEKEVNALLAARHHFGDHALLRREMVDRGLMWRTADGSLYRRVEQRPPAEARAVIRRLSGRADPG